MHEVRHDGCCRASYCEIYNEALYDLLHWTREQLQVRWDAGRGFHVPGLALKECATVGDLLNVRALATGCHLMLLYGALTGTALVDRGQYAERAHPPEGHMMLPCKQTQILAWLSMST